MVIHCLKNLIFVKIMNLSIKMSINNASLREIVKGEKNKVICCSEKVKIGNLKTKLSDDHDLINPKKVPRLESYRPENENASEEIEYYFENGLRKVYPYYFTFSTFCKGRWVGKRLCDVFAQEFRTYNKEHYRKQIELGLLKVNGSIVSTDYTLKNNDYMTHKVHRHELAVLGGPIKIIYLDDDLVVIDKPPSIPVHPCGRYRHNSVLFILKKEHELKDLHTIHRLDRLTSGILLFTKTLQKSQEIDEYIRSHQVEKEYLCRVEGIFPDESITCSQPIEILSKIGVCIISSSGKESKTEFKKLSYNGKSSLVLCKPSTGRMHQIRVHLQYLGYPIINDPIYSHKDEFGPSRGKHGEIGKSKEQLIEDHMEIHQRDYWLNSDSKNKIDKERSRFIKFNEILKKILESCANLKDCKNLEHYQKNSDKILFDSTCDFCRKRYRDPEPKDLIMFLHAYRYKSDIFEFQTELPIWAKDGWNEL